MVANNQIIYYLLAFTITFTFKKVISSFYKYILLNIDVFNSLFEFISDISTISFCSINSGKNNSFCIYELGI